MSVKQNLSTQELSTELGVSVVTLAQARAGNSSANGFTALPFVKIGRRIFYRRSDVDTFLEQHLSAGTDVAKNGGA